MTPSETTITGLNWKSLTEQLDVEGYALLSGLLGLKPRVILGDKPRTWTPLIAWRLHRPIWDVANCSISARARQIQMDIWRTVFYRHLAIIANPWNEVLGISDRYPATLVEFLRRNKKNRSASGAVSFEPACG